MCNDLLPDNVNALLDDVETGLCLPILLLIILCTLQFILNDTLDIGCTVATAIKSAKSMMEPTADSSFAESLSMRMPTKLKGMLSHLGMRFGVLAETQLDSTAETIPAKSQRSRERPD